MSLKVAYWIAFVLAACSGFLYSSTTQQQQPEGSQSQQQKASPVTDPKKSDRIPVKENIEILSDTMGVDFGPYLRAAVETVKEHWYKLMPESAKAPMMKKGEVAAEFAILREGSFGGLKIQKSSGDPALDRAAYQAIVDAQPFPRLPNEFKGPFLQVRFKFYYNPAKDAVEPSRSK